MIRGYVLTMLLTVAACASTPDPCSGMAGTCLAILVDDSPELDEVRVTLSSDGIAGWPRQSTSTNPTGRSFSAPFDLAITIDDTLIATSSLAVDVLVEGLKAGVLVAQGSRTQQTLHHGSNPAVHLSLVPLVGVGDLAGSPDLAAMEGAMDMAIALIDMAQVDLSAVCIDGSVRCKATDHSSQQNCVGGQWVDQKCMAPSAIATPPIYACTEAQHRCVDTGWVQWSLKVGPPTPRFVTIPSTGTVGEDITYDTLTGLNWQLTGTTSSTYTYALASSHCAGLTYGGISGDWRIPTSVEFDPILQHSGAGGFFVVGPFQGQTMGQYWTSSPQTASTTNHFAVDTSGGFAGTPDTLLRSVRCVR